MLAVQCVKYAETAAEAVRVNSISPPSEPPPPKRVLLDVLAAGADFVQVVPLVPSLQLLQRRGSSLAMASAALSQLGAAQACEP